MLYKELVKSKGDLSRKPHPPRSRYIDVVQMCPAKERPMLFLRHDVCCYTETSSWALTIHLSWAIGFLIAIFIYYIGRHI